MRQILGLFTLFAEVRGGVLFPLWFSAPRFFFTTLLKIGAGIVLWFLVALQNYFNCFHVILSPLHCFIGLFHVFLVHFIHLAFLVQRLVLWELSQLERFSRRKLFGKDGNGCQPPKEQPGTLPRSSTPVPAARSMTSSAQWQRPFLWTKCPRHETGPFCVQHLSPPTALFVLPLAPDPVTRIVVDDLDWLRTLSGPDLQSVHPTLGFDKPIIQPISHTLIYLSLILQIWKIIDFDQPYIIIYNTKIIGIHKR